MIALLEIGWFSTQSLRREDARLVDVIAQYLSVELMAAFTAMQHARAAEVDAVMTEAVRTIDALTEVDRARVVAAFDPVARVLDALLVPVSVDEHKHLLLATLPDASVALPLPDEGDGEDAQSGCVVKAISGRSVMRAHLCEHSAWSIGAYIDLGLVNDERVCMLLVRSEDAEPFEDGDMRALHSAVRACRVKLDGVKERSNDTHIAQALQQGMAAFNQHASALASGAQLPAGASVSAAALAPDKATAENTILSRFFDGISAQAKGTSWLREIPSNVAGLWGRLLLLQVHDDFCVWRFFSCHPDSAYCFLHTDSHSVRLPKEGY